MVAPLVEKLKSVFKWAEVKRYKLNVVKTKG